jgi:dolichol-phosphate mannosyltransferase
LHHIACVPTHDASNGFRMFSRRAIDTIAVESDAGFCYSIELLVKAHRLGWKIGEVPARWFERAHGQSRFRVLRWLPAYLRWYAYAFATTFLRRGADTVPMKTA